MADDHQRPLRKRGRPPHEPTPDLRARVAHLTSEGSTVAVIAKQVGISEPTLRAHYERELLANKPHAPLPFDPNTDLGQAPPRDTNPGGRPEHIPTEENRHLVEVLAAAGMFAWQIAANLKISEPTLRLHYGEELLLGASRKKGEMLASMFTAGRAGNVAAMKGFLAACREHGDTPLENQVPKAPEPKLGKKEQQLIDARSPNASTSLGALMAERLGHSDGRLN